MKSFLPNLIIGIIGIVALVFLAQRLIANKVVAPLDEYMASSTAEQNGLASSTATTTSNTDSEGNNSIDQNAGLSSTTLRFFKPGTSASSILKAKKSSVNSIQAFVADNDTTMQKGLGDRASLPQNEGMIFVFPEPGSVGFWMKDMQFSLDMVWIGDDKVVKGVTKNISPDTYPNIFLPPVPVKYVLEVNAGMAEKLGIVKGSMVNF